MTASKDRTIYFDGDSKPITFARLEDDLIEVGKIIEASLEIVKLIEDENGDITLLPALKATLEYGLKKQDSLTPDCFDPFGLEKKESHGRLFCRYLAEEMGISGK